MKLTTILVAASCLTAQAFGVSPRSNSVVKHIDVNSNTLRKQAPSTVSPLFRDAALTRAGAIPGWTAYNEALDKNPLTAKACTSLVGWFLGDLLAQVSFGFDYIHTGPAFAVCAIYCHLLLLQTYHFAHPTPCSVLL